MTRNEVLATLTKVAINRFYAPIRWKQISPNCFAFMAAPKSKPRGYHSVCEIMWLEQSGRVSVCEIDHPKVQELWLYISPTVH